jgi:hypothetical protein
VPRPAKRARTRAGLTDLWREYLISGYWTGGRGTEPSAEEAAEMWEAHRIAILDLEGTPEGFPLGAGPFAFWRFDVGLDGIPSDQVGCLAELGLIDSQELASIAASAREQARSYASMRGVEAQAVAEQFTNSQLLASWPHLPPGFFELLRGAAFAKTI